MKMRLYLWSGLVYEADLTGEEKVGDKVEVLFGIKDSPKRSKYLLKVCQDTQGIYLLGAGKRLYTKLFRKNKYSKVFYPINKEEE